MRGLSGAVTALILVVASVVIALIVVGFAFNLFGAFASQGTTTVVPVGSARLYTGSAPSIVSSPLSGNNVVYLVVTLDNKGPNVNISSAEIYNQIVIPSKEYVVTKNGQGQANNGQGQANNGQGQANNGQGQANNGQGQANPVTGFYVPAGPSTIVLAFSGVNIPSSVNGSVINVELRLSNNQAIELNALVD